MTAATALNARPVRGLLAPLPDRIVKARRLIDDARADLELAVRQELPPGTRVAIAYGPQRFAATVDHAEIAADGRPFVLAVLDHADAHWIPLDHVAGLLPVDPTQLDPC